MLLGLEFVAAAIVVTVLQSLNAGLGHYLWLVVSLTIASVVGRLREAREL